MEGGGFLEKKHPRRGFHDLEFHSGKKNSKPHTYNEYLQKKKNINQSHIENIL